MMGLGAECEGLRGVLESVEEGVGPVGRRYGDLEERATELLGRYTAYVRPLRSLALAGVTRLMLLTDQHAFRDLYLVERDRFRGGGAGYEVGEGEGEGCGRRVARTAARKIPIAVAIPSQFCSPLASGGMGEFHSRPLAHWSWIAA